MGQWPPQQRLRRRRSRGRLSRLVLVVAVVFMVLVSVSAQEAGVDAASADGTDGSTAVGATDAPAGSTASANATPAATTAAPVATDAATTTAPEAETPVPTETTPTPTEATPTPTTAAPTETPVPTTAAPTETPVPTTAAPVETTAPTTEAPTTAPVTDAPVATTAAPAPTTTAPAATTAAPTPTTTAPAATTTAPTPTPTPTPATNAPTTSAASSSSGSSQTSSSGTYKSSTSDEESGAGTVAPADLTTLSPISGDSDADDATTDSSSASSVGTSTSSASSATLGTWQIALIVSGVLVAVVASLFFVRFQNHRGRVFKRARGSSQQRALDSFFRQNRVTLMASVNHSSSQLAFNATRNGGHFTAPLTPPEQIPTTSLGPREAPPTATAADARPRGRTADVIAGPAADMFSRDTTRSAMSSTRSYSGGDFDSFIGQSYANSNHSSSVYYTPSERSDSIVDSSVASTTNRSTRRFLARHMSSGGEPSRGTVRSDRSSSDFSVFNSSVDSIDDSQRTFVSITLPTTTTDSARSGGLRANSDASDGSESFLGRESRYSRDSYDSYGVAPESAYRVSELSEGEI